MSNSEVLVVTTSSPSESGKSQHGNINHEYPRKLLQALNDMREQNQLCDIVINIGERAFPAHRAVLAASSSYFSAMFTSGFRESSASEVSMDVDAEGFEVLLQYAYTGRLNISQKTAYDVLDIACYMHFTDICKTCSDFIEGAYVSESGKITVGDAFKIAMLARNHDNLAELAKASDKYLEGNVQELKRTDVFLENASKVFFKEFLSRKDLSSNGGETEVLEMVVGWLKRDWANRWMNAHDLLQKVRLGLVPTERLNQLIDAELLAIPECKALIDSVLQLQLSEKSKSKSVLALENPELFATRSTITVPISTYVIKDMVTQHRFHYYHEAEQCWKDLEKFDPLPHSNFSHCLIVVNGRLYAGGGVQKGLFLLSAPVIQKDFYCYNTVENRWIRLPPMNKRRDQHNYVYLDGFIYAIGGYSYMIKEVERYNIVEEEWEVIAPLPVMYRHVSAQAFKGRILVHGEMVEDGNPQILYERALHVYNPKTGAWQTTLQERGEVGHPTKPPVLFIHEDTCYRVLYHDVHATDTSLPLHHRTGISRPLVNILEFQFEDDSVTVTVGEEIKQNHIPDNRVGAFRVKDEVFVKQCGSVYNTGIKISPEQSTDLNLDKWESFRDFEARLSNVVYFTFDRKLLEK